MTKLQQCSVALLFFCSIAGANTTGSLNLSLPGLPGSFQSDSFRANGLDCSMAIGSSTNVEFGVIGLVNRDNQQVTTAPTNPNDPRKNVGVYGRIIIPIGAPKDRLDCNELYQLELRKKRMEIQKLEGELNNLRNLKFENSGSK
jgi:hypothetical protein